MQTTQKNEATSPRGTPDNLLIKVRGVGFEPTKAFATGS